MTKAWEAIETGIEVLWYIERGVAIGFFLAMGYGVFITVQLIEARHKLAAAGLL